MWSAKAGPEGGRAWPRAGPQTLVGLQDVPAVLPISQGHADVLLGVRDGQNSLLLCESRRPTLLCRRPAGVRKAGLVSGGASRGAGGAASLLLAVSCLVRSAGGQFL